MFIDRQDAGERLAEALKRFKGDKPVVLALPRGGVPVAKVIAEALDAPLDVLLVKKIGAPGHNELAIGAVADGDNPILLIDKETAHLVGAGDAYIEVETARKLEEIEQRHQMYRNAAQNGLSVAGRTVILVDDGIATGSTVRVALKSLRASGVKHLVLAVPLAPAETISQLENEADEIICLATPTPFFAISPHYRHFDQVSDSEVIEILAHRK